MRLENDIMDCKVHDLDLILSRHVMTNNDDLRIGSLFANEIKEIFKSIKVAFIGYANDEGVVRNGGRKGAAGGPDVVRAMMKRKGCVVNEEYQVSLHDIEIKDFGNSEGEQDLKTLHKTHQTLVEEVLQEGYLPLIVGGGNDQSYPNCMALLHHLQKRQDNTDDREVLIVNIDAHLDVRPLLEGAEPHSGSPFRQIMETQTQMILKFVEFGCQGSQCSTEHVQYVRDKGGRIIWLKDLHGSLLEDNEPMKSTSDVFSSVISKDSYSDIFVSFDIDSIRYNDCPGVSCPSPIGLTAEEALSICYISGKCNKVRMIDFSEFNPKIESYMTGTLVTNMIYYFLMGLKNRKT